MESAGEKPISARALLDLAAINGFQVTPTQLARWHRAGVLPRPIQHSLGRGKGTETRYPAGTGVLLLAICDARAHRRKLEHVAWGLWWSGHDVPMQLVRSFVEKWATKVDEMIYRHEARPSPDKLQRARLSKPLSGVRKRVGRQVFPAVVDSLFGIMSDHHLSIDSNTFVRALGLHRARTDRTFEAGPLIDHDVLGSLKELSTTIHGVSLKETLRATSDQLFTTSRDELRNIIYILGIAERQTGRLFGRGSFGLDVVKRWVDQPVPEAQAITVLLWPILKNDASLAAGMDRFAGTRPTLVAAERNALILESMRIEFPEIASLLTPKEIGSALRSKRKWKHLQATLGQFRKKHRPRLDEFFKKHRSGSPT